MIYRIFRRTDANARYLLPLRSDVDVKGTFENAAREWADLYAPAGVRELDLMVGRFSANRIGELFPIKLKRSPSPWVRVNTYTPDCTCDEEKDDF